MMGAENGDHFRETAITRELYLYNIYYMLKQHKMDLMSFPADFSSYRSLLHKCVCSFRGVVIGNLLTTTTPDDPTKDMKVITTWGEDVEFDPPWADRDLHGSFWDSWASLKQQTQPIWKGVNTNYKCPGQNILGRGVIE